jgi:hypothetical protein
MKTEAVRPLVQLAKEAIERFREGVGSMSGDVLAEGPRVELAAADLQVVRENLRILEYVVRDRDRSFHTQSLAIEP